LIWAHLNAQTPSQCINKLKWHRKCNLPCADHGHPSMECEHVPHTHILNLTVCTSLFVSTYQSCSLTSTTICPITRWMAALPYMYSQQPSHSHSAMCTSHHTLLLATCNSSTARRTGDTAPPMEEQGWRCKEPGHRHTGIRL
jgi:hypothetical protein